MKSLFSFPPGQIVSSGKLSPPGTVPLDEGGRMIGMSSFFLPIQVWFSSKTNHMPQALFQGCDPSECVLVSEWLVSGLL